MNKGRPNSKSRSWNKKTKSKNIMRAWCECKKNLFQKLDKNGTKLYQKYEPKIDVEKTKGNVGFYFYLYPLDT